MVMWHGDNKHNDLQRGGSSLFGLSKIRIFSCLVPLRAVGTRRRVRLKYQKNGKVVWKFVLGQGEEDGDCLLLVHDSDNELMSGSTRSRDIMRTLADSLAKYKYITFHISDAKDLVTRLELRQV